MLGVYLTAVVGAASEQVTLFAGVPLCASCCSVQKLQLVILERGILCELFIDNQSRKENNHLF